MSLDSVNCFVGLDVGRETMQAVWINEGGQRIGSLSFPNNHNGYETFMDKLGSLGCNGLSPVVGTEGHSGEVSPLDEYLTQQEFPFVSIQPSRVYAHKSILGQLKKTDDYDAYAIADFLWSRRNQLDQMPKFESLVQKVKKLSRTNQDLQKEENRYVNRLRQTVTEYFPEFLQEDWFSKLTDKTPLCILASYPSIEKFRETGIDDLASFLREKSRGHHGKRLATEIITTVKKITRSVGDNTAYAIRIKSLAELLLTLRERRNDVKSAIKEALIGWEDADIVKSLPGAGNILSAQLLGEIGSINRFHSSDAFALYCGVAPIPHSSGKWRSNKNTKRVNRVAKDALMQIAQASRRFNDISDQYYQRKRDEGKNHWHALKCLARNLARVIYAMLKNRTYYEPKTGGEEKERGSSTKEKQPVMAKS